MAAWTSRQARDVARRIRERLGPAVARATAGTSVESAALAGLIAVENSALDPSAQRFEPRVYEALRDVQRGVRPVYNGVRRALIADASDAALRNLATSWGLTQIMGYHALVSFDPPITVAELRGPRHLEYAVRLWERLAGRYLRAGALETAYRIWNTGSPTGRTYDPYYVANAMLVRGAYQELEFDGGEKKEMAVGVMSAAALLAVGTASETLATTLAGLLAPILTEVIKRVAGAEARVAFIIALACSFGLALLSLFATGELRSAGDLYQTGFTVLGLATTIYKLLVGNRN